MMLVRNLIFLPKMWIRLCYHAKHVDKYTDEEHSELFKYVVYRANKGGNVIIDAHGVENIPKEDGFIFYPNHQGMYDILAMVDSCPRPLAVIAKQEVKNVPLLKQVLKASKSFYIDRDDVKQSMKVIVSVMKEVAKGRNYVIFAEGTRSKNGNNTLDFKGGSFKAATKVKAPIVPVALVDSFKPFDSHTISKVTVQVYYLEPILYEEYKDMPTTEIAKIVRERIQKVLDEKSNS